MNLAGEYLTTAEVAELLRIKPKTVRNKVAAGVFRHGEHFFKKPGLGPRWKREAVVRWLEHSELEKRSPAEVVPLSSPSRRWA